jgi:hypothetical protein
MVEYGTSSYGLETGSAAGELGLDSLKAGQLLIVHMMIPLRFASQAGAGQAVVHYMDIYFVFVADFLSKAGSFVPECIRTRGGENSPPVGARPAAIAQHDDGISLSRWRPCRQRKLPVWGPENFWKYLWHICFALLNFRALDELKLIIDLWP